MKYSVPNTIPEKDLQFLLSNPEITKAKAGLSTSSKVQFTIELSDSIKASLQTTLGLDLHSLNRVPMTWIRGDSPHIATIVDYVDAYLIYLVDSQGELLMDGRSYPIEKSRGYVCSKGLSIETKGVGSIPRILLGPMTETGLPL